MQSNLKDVEADKKYVCYGSVIFSTITYVLYDDLTKMWDCKQVSLGLLCHQFVQNTE